MLRYILGKPFFRWSLSSLPVAVYQQPAKRRAEAKKGCFAVMWLTLLFMGICPTYFTRGKEGRNAPLSNFYIKSHENTILGTGMWIGANKIEKNWF